MKSFIVLGLAATTLLSGTALADHHVEKAPLLAPAGATVTETTVVHQKELKNYNKVNFMDFDLNKDGTLSRDEVGEKLFQLFDHDGNEVIDNIEMKNPSVLTFIPMEKQTVKVVDYGSDNSVDAVSVTDEIFLETSSLIKFDDQADGLSPLDFLETPFLQVDVDKDKVINLYEWKRAYADLVKPLHEENFIYND